jgi:hypothetical protein
MNKFLRENAQGMAGIFLIAAVLILFAALAYAAFQVLFGSVDRGVGIAVVATAIIFVFRGTAPPP